MIIPKTVPRHLYMYCWSDIISFMYATARKFVRVFEQNSDKNCSDNTVK